jgi:hypothetical protein
MPGPSNCTDSHLLRMAGKERYDEANCVRTPMRQKALRCTDIIVAAGMRQAARNTEKKSVQRSSRRADRVQKGKEEA